MLGLSTSSLGRSLALSASSSSLAPATDRAMDCCFRCRLCRCRPASRQG